MTEVDGQAQATMVARRRVARQRSGMMTMSSVLQVRVAFENRFIKILQKIGMYQIAFIKIFLKNLSGDQYLY